MELEMAAAVANEAEQENRSAVDGAPPRTPEQMSAARQRSQDMLQSRISEMLTGNSTGVFDFQPTNLFPPAPDAANTDGTLVTPPRRQSSSRRHTGDREGGSGTGTGERRRHHRHRTDPAGEHDGANANTTTVDFVIFLCSWSYV